MENDNLAPVVRRQMSDMFLSTQFFSYFFGTLVTFSTGRCHWRTRYWRYILLINLTGLAGTVLGAIEFNLMLDRRFTPYSVLVVISEMAWVANETTPILISHMKLKTCYASATHRRRSRRALLMVFATLVALRIWMIEKRIEKDSLWNDSVARAHVGYFLALALADFVFAVLFTRFIGAHYMSKKNPVRGQHHDASDERIALAFVISSCYRILFVNVMIVAIIVSFFFLSDPVGNFFFNFLCCFKYNFGIIFLVDMLLVRAQARRSQGWQAGGPKITPNSSLDRQRRGNNNPHSLQQQQQHQHQQQQLQQMIPGYEFPELGPGTKSISSASGSHIATYKFSCAAPARKASIKSYALNNTSSADRKTDPECSVDSSDGSCSRDVAEHPQCRLLSIIPQLHDAHEGMDAILKSIAPDAGSLINSDSFARS